MLCIVGSCVHWPLWKLSWSLDFKNFFYIIFLRILVESISFWNKRIKSTCSCSFCKGSQATPAAAQSAVLWCEPDAATLWLQRLKTLVLAHQPWLSSTHLSPHYFVIHSHHNSIINNTQKMGQENDYGDPGWPGTQGHTSFPVSWIMKNPFVSFGRRVQDDEHQ